MSACCTSHNCLACRYLAACDDHDTHYDRCGACQLENYLEDRGDGRCHRGEVLRVAEIDARGAWKPAPPRKWCDQGHLMSYTTPTCPWCDSDARDARRKARDA